MSQSLANRLVGYSEFLLVREPTHFYHEFQRTLLDSQIDIRGKLWICPFCLSRNSFPPHYKDISNTNLPAELLPKYTTIEYTLARPIQILPIFLLLSTHVLTRTIWRLSVMQLWLAWVSLLMLSSILSLMELWYFYWIYHDDYLLRNSTGFSTRDWLCRV